ncbi:MAG: hypothetical protein A2015_01405 [Spirochaetes bacterium GWF1_31_7]|nr:MAG: hypothetical protein A2Y30_07995 [Spirochaetes bacterium GWE1_32_154]OHD47850.1 MAG: hypothetical protein A2015_01405 [Spirochaetes bacterium GWF1_31_7]OHD52211.1 MAG: hypothetical protein A2Y29_17640 [Spirochaetes bacterium GWE2_31_10]OHD78887.1 MAG: hypothetical protein A2355_01315 [Spirochaetes bacterium RIFOXYB1_FULL_32_8]HBD95223.1 trimeric intracellular cation channel family protein [Spirochaetia bacterium]
MEYFIYLDLIGTLIFAITGAFRAVKHELDILGVLVLATFTGVGGGILRDIILGKTPPAVFQNELHLIICIIGGLVVFFAAPKIAENWPVIKIGDAIGLGVFAVLGAWKGAESGLGPIGTVLIGTISAVGGGVIRDLLVMEIPAVIRTDFYATAAAMGSLCYYICYKLHVSLPVSLISGLSLTTGTRILAMIFKLNLPKVNRLPQEPSEISKNKHKHII